LQSLSFETSQEDTSGGGICARVGILNEEVVTMSVVSLPSAAIGWVSLAAGVAGLLGFAFIILFFTVGQPFGTLNDVFICVTALLSLALALMLYPSFHARLPSLSLTALVIGLAGVVLVVAGSVLAISGRSGFYLSGLYMSAGYALVGLWLMALSYSALRADALPHGLSILGVIAGAMMALGLVAIPGIVRGVDTKEYQLTVVNAILGTSWMGYFAVFPVWCVLQGRMIVAG
jgi:hypothetical protein